MTFFRHPDYLEARKHSKWRAFLYVIADFSYYIGVIGGLIGCLSFLLLWPFDWLKGSSLRPWTFYAEGFLGVLGLAALLIGIGAVVARYIRIHRG